MEGLFESIPKQKKNATKKYLARYVFSFCKTKCFARVQHHDGDCPVLATTPHFPASEIRGNNLVELRMNANSTEAERDAHRLRQQRHHEIAEEIKALAHQKQNDAERPALSDCANIQ